MFWQLILLLVLLIPLLAIVLDSKFGQALAQRMEGRRIAPPDDATQERLRYLETEVDRLSEELGRVQEESDFLHRLLTERSSASGPGGSGPSSEGAQRELPRVDRAD